MRAPLRSASAGRCVALPDGDAAVRRLHVEPSVREPIRADAAQVAGDSSGNGWWRAGSPRHGQRSDRYGAFMPLAIVPVIVRSVRTIAVELHVHDAALRVEGERVSGRVVGPY